MRIIIAMLFFSLVLSLLSLAQPLSLASSGQEKTGLSLQECIGIALSNNSEIKRGELGLRRSDIEYRQARLNILPSLGANLGHGINQGRSVDPTTNQFVESTFSSGNLGISADMTLFNGFRALHDIRMKSQAREAGRLEYEGRVNEIKLDVIEAYVQVLTATDMLVQSLNQLEVTKEQLRRAEIMHEEGEFAPGDYYDIRGQFKSEENQLETTRKTLFAARLRLARLLQTDESSLGTLQSLQAKADPAAGIEAGALFADARQSFAPFRALDYRIAEARQQLGTARSALYPSLGIGAGLSSRYSNHYETSYGTQLNQNLGKYISLSMRIPVFNRMQTLNNIKQARLAVQDVQLQKELREQQLKEETATAVFNLQTTRTAISNLREQVAHYSESFRIAQTHFEAGASNSFLFLAAKNKLDAARQQLLVKQYEYVLQQYINDYYQGNLGF